MSAPGRPKRELAPKREARRFILFAPGRPKRELAPKREARRFILFAPGEATPSRGPKGAAARERGRPTRNRRMRRFHKEAEA